MRLGQTRSILLSGILMISISGFAAKMPASAMNPSSTSQAQPSGPFSDREIRHLINGYQALRVNFTNLGKKRALTPELKTFTTQTLLEYKRLPLKPLSALAPHPQIQSLTEKSRQRIQDLEKLKGTDFDKKYLQSDMALQRDILKKIEDDLLPVAQNIDLKNTLTLLRTQIKAQLDDDLDTYISISKN